MPLQLCYNLNWTSQMSPAYDKKMLLPMFCWNYIFSKKVQNLQHWHSANTQKTSFGRSLGFCGRSFGICVQVCRFMCNARWSEREKHLKIKQKWLCIAHSLFETLWSHTHTLTCRIGCIWRVWLRCVFWSASSVHHFERSATHSHPTNTCTASHLQAANKHTTALTI